VPRPRVAVLSEDPVTRTGLATLLAATGEVEVIGGAAPGRSEVAGLAVDLADVLLVDAGAPPPGAFPAPAGLPAVAVVEDERQAVGALAAGARALVFRHAPAERLAAALVAVYRGLVVVDEALAPWVRAPASAAGSAGEATLTPREAEVLALLAEGLSNKGIAARLGVGDRTAKFHVESILAKLGAQSRSEAIVIAARRGLVAL
jgi:DNA-binding NarL/FixJ family response regulator